MSSMTRTSIPSEQASSMARTSTLARQTLKRGMRQAWHAQAPLQAGQLPVDGTDQRARKPGHCAWAQKGLVGTEEAQLRNEGTAGHLCSRRGVAARAWGKGGPTLHGLPGWGCVRATTRIGEEMHVAARHLGSKRA
eukprot:363451-Chlamydomonas_euryale.AAC.18